MKRKILPYNPVLKALAHNLRAGMTFSEVKLWNQLKQKQMMGMDFDRQRPILNYIVDFYCKDLMLAIEIDGSSHQFKSDEDIIRQNELEEAGVRFLRFSDAEVKYKIDDVLQIIARFIEGEQDEYNPPLWFPSREGMNTTHPFGSPPGRG